MPECNPAPLIIHLLGPFEARLHGAPLPHLRSRKGQWLLALLALHQGREVDRRWLAGTLWPGSSEGRALGPEAPRLHAPQFRALCLILPGAAVDVVAFDAAIARGDAGSLREAVDLYRGPLLEECAEEWVLPEREAREAAYLCALENL